MKPNEYSALALAYLGDAVIELMVRETLIKSGNKPELLHAKAMLFVSAARQSEALGNILPSLNDEETEIYKRGRNAKAKAPKSASAAQYSRATGMECLFGYLYLTGEKDRIEELFCAAFAPLDPVT
ncbi:MAG: Mini-ribonuclease 3 [Oscillospiraceae bacterium]|nr:Mini-ribonuclease 3 [Oscillospiraceae bacterium]